MKTKNYYIRGFTLIEMTISMIIGVIATGTMMYVFNAAQGRYFNDQMERDIDEYSHHAMEFVAKIVEKSDSEIRRVGKNKYIIDEFYDIYYNQDSQKAEDHHRSITIEMHDKVGVLIRENNKDITKELYTKYMRYDHKTLNGHYKADPREDFSLVRPQGLFRPGGAFSHENEVSGDQNLQTIYTIYEFKIKQVDVSDQRGKTYPHRIRSARVRASMKKSTYDIVLKIEVQNKLDTEDGTTDLYTYRRYAKRAYCPSFFLREYSQNNKISKNEI